MRLPIFHVGASESSTFREVLQIGIAHHAKELQNARALVDGKMAGSEKYLTSDDTHTVELLLPFMNCSSTEACSLNEVAGLVVLTGSICATAYLGPREPISQAISDLKGDIISSLQSRLDIIYDDADDKVDMPGGHDGELHTDAQKAIHQLNLQEQRKSCGLQFPRRVLIPKSDGTVICDYLQPKETIEDLKDRCKEMMAMEAPIEDDMIMEVETEAALVIANSLWDLINGGSTLHESKKNMKTSTRRDSDEPGIYSMNNLVPAFLIFLAAVIIGVAIGLFGK